MNGYHLTVAKYCSKCGSELQVEFSDATKRYDRQTGKWMLHSEAWLQCPTRVGFWGGLRNKLAGSHDRLFSYIVYKQEDGETTYTDTYGNPVDVEM